MELHSQEIASLIKQQIKDYKGKVTQNDTGTVMTVGDGIATVYGLENCMSNELIEFSDGVFGMALNLEKDFVGAVLLGSDETIKEGDSVKRTGKIVSVPVGEALLGRVVNALGQPIDGKGPIITDQTRPIETPAPGIIER
ncbi:MAG: F0F1 ATP synthase subunit alpha, partial [Oscillospiraceae bacterium]